MKSRKLKYSNCLRLKPILFVAEMKNDSNPVITGFKSLYYNMRYFRLSDFLDASPLGCEFSIWVYRKLIIAEVFNFADLKVRAIWVQCCVKSDVSEKPIPDFLNVKIVTCIKTDDLQSLVPKTIPLVRKDGGKILTRRLILEFPIL